MTVAAPDLSVVVVTYRSAGFVDTCLRTIRAEGLTLEVIVVDNDSPDDTVRVVATAHPDATIIEMGGNTGFATAVNAGVARASGRHVLLLNPDAEVHPGALDAMVRCADGDPAIGVVAPRLLNADGTDQGTARAFPTPAAALFGRRSPLTRLFPRNRWSSRFLVGLQRSDDEPFDVDWVSGACLLSPRGLFEELGGLDEGFFMHFEDADWCRRVGDVGRRVRVLPAATVLHHEGGCRQGWPPSQVRAFHRGAYRYWSKHHVRGAVNPLRLVAASLLAARALAVMSKNQLLHRGADRAARPLAPLGEGVV